MKLLKQHIEQSSDPEFVDYAAVLEKCGIPFEKTGMYLNSSGIPLASGWILHVSIVEPEIITAINRLVHLLKRPTIKWKLIRDSDAARMMLDGKAGKEIIGKVFSIYVAEDELLPTAEELIRITADLKGPFVPTDAHLGGCVYTRYGGFVSQMGVEAAGNRFPVRMNKEGKWEKDLRNIPFKLPEHVAWPYSVGIAGYPETKVPASYQIVKVLSDRSKGQVLLLEKNGQSAGKDLYVLKQGRKYMWFDRNGKDMTDRIIQQAEMNLRIKEFCLVPELIETFQVQGNQYLLYRFMEGKLLTRCVEEAHEYGQPWQEIRQDAKIELQDYFLQICGYINWLHQNGILHRDISPENFLICPDGKVAMIDFEMEPIPANDQNIHSFKLGTPGFMSENILSNGQAKKEDDYYALGALLFYLCTGIIPTVVDLSQQENIKGLLSAVGVTEKVCETICGLTSTKENERAIAFQNICDSSYIEIFKNETISAVQFDYGAFRLMEMLPTFVQNAINALAEDTYWKTNDLWQYISRNGGEAIGIRKGFYEGLAGTLFMLGEVEKMGYSLQNIQPLLYRAIDHISHEALSNNFQEPPGLYAGIAGYVLGISHLAGNSDRQAATDTVGMLIESLPGNISTIDFATGISGVGLAAIAASGAGNEKAQEIVAVLHNAVVTAPLEDHLRNESENVVLSFYNGAAGVLFFQLLADKMVGDYYSNQIVAERMNIWIKRYTEFLVRIETSGEPILTNKETVEKILWGAQVSLLHNKKRRNEGTIEIIDRALQLLPPEPVLGNIAMNNGLSLLGHTYLDAWNVTNNNEYSERALWIGEFIVRLSKYDGTNPYWATDVNPPSPDYMNGTAGIIHYLSRLSLGGAGHSLFQSHKAERGLFSNRISRVTSKT